ncbi:MAG: hypothetical protein ABW278_09980 [Steroidobacteraceae bacterium]
MSRAALTSLLGAELAQAAPEAARALATELARRGGRATAAVLYYGSNLRAESLDGILDFYVLLDDVDAWPGSPLAHLGNRLLPPNVGYIELPYAGPAAGPVVLRAKYAVLSTAQFARRVRMTSVDTTIWARFCQPALCAWRRSPADFDLVSGLMADAVITAANWAARLGPDAAVAADFWRALFARTYAAELRVEKSARPQDIVGKHPQRYAETLALAWIAAGIRSTEQANRELQPVVSAGERARANSQWRRRARWGRPLNVLRLVKAAFTFEGGMDYIAWKIERHRGIRIEVAPWQRRFPLLAAPGLYWKLRRQGVLR